MLAFSIVQDVFSAVSMRRREFIMLIGALAAALSLATCVEPAGAQSTVPQKRLGLLSGFGCSRGALARRLAELAGLRGGPSSMIALPRSVVLTRTS